MHGLLITTTKRRYWKEFGEIAEQFISSFVLKCPIPGPVNNDIVQLPL